MRGNGLGPMNDGNGWCSNPRYAGFGGRGAGRSVFGRGRFINGMGRGFGRGLARGWDNSGFGPLGFGRNGFGQDVQFPQGRGLGPGRGMGFMNGGPGYGNRVARGWAYGQPLADDFAGGWTKPARENSAAPDGVDQKE